VQLVDEAVLEHCPHERAAAADVEVTVDVVLEPANRVRVIGADDFEFRQDPEASVPETTYLVVSLKNGAPGSSAAVRFDQAGSNIS
jgi:hypothetical protein